MGELGTPLSPIGSLSPPHGDLPLPQYFLNALPTFLSFLVQVFSISKYAVHFSTSFMLLKDTFKFQCEIHTNPSHPIGLLSPPHHGEIHTANNPDFMNSFHYLFRFCIWNCCQPNTEENVQVKK